MSKLLFMVSTTSIVKEEEPYFFDPSDNMSEKSQQGHAFHLSIDLKDFICMAEVDKFFNDIKDEEMLGYYEPFDSLAFAMQAQATIPEAKNPNHSWHGDHLKYAILWKTLHNWLVFTMTMFSRAT